MNVLLLGSGGREHALAWKLRQSPHLETLYIAPGNAGTAAVGTNVPLDPTDGAAVVAFARQHEVSLVVIGPEAPLVAGVADACHAVGLPVIGPTKAAARLEGSKQYAKDFFQRQGIPTARFEHFGVRQQGAALAYLQTLQPPYVIKADGLAAGKGVVIAETLAEAEAAVKSMLEKNSLGEAGNRIVIEEYLDGVEVSMFALCDGRDFVLLPEAKDYKRIGEGNTGPNTGGMGSVSPVPFVDDEFRQTVAARIIGPTLRGMAAEGNPFQGILFAGLMVVNGQPYVLEYNVRLGDPETQSVLSRIDSDLLLLFLAAAEGRLSGQKVQVSPQATCTVVLASAGYPGDSPKGLPIHNLTPDNPDVQVFHAGTASKEGQPVTAGGRVLAVTARAESPLLAQQAALAAADSIQFEGKQFRRDIGADMLAWPKAPAATAQH